MLARIATRVGTPTYVYDIQAIRSQFQSLHHALAGLPHRICYSLKANSNIGLLSFVRSLGAGADIVSGGELARALRAGFDAADIVFSGVGKTAVELDDAIRVGVGLINVESPGEMGLISERARATGSTARIGIRINPDVTTDTHPYTQTGERGVKFGVPLDEVPELAVRAFENHDLALSSVGMHLGSQIHDAQPFAEGAEKLEHLVTELRAVGIDSLHSVDVGGGLGVAYGSESPLDLNTFTAAVTPLVERTRLRLLLEPGRFLVANAGQLLTRCLYRKRSGGRDIAVVDAGMNDFLRPSLYSAIHEIEVVEAARHTESAGAATVDVVGPVCETGDAFGTDRELRGVGPGALLSISGAGAYGFTMSSQYNSRPRAAEVLLDGERFATGRTRETIEDLMLGESATPEWTS